MKPNRIPLACAALALLMLPLAASAWSAYGHRTVAALAATELTPSARAQVAWLLKDEADPSLPGVASWADQIRENDPDLGRRSAKWHYVNRPAGTCDYVPERDCDNGDCVIEAIRRQAEVMGDRSQPRELRAQALKFVVHFIGDVHQPLHAGLRSDRGGNDVQVNLEGEGMNLHALWDRELLASRGLDQATHVKRLARLPTADIPPGEAEEWARESCEIMRVPGFYPPSAKVDSRYVVRWRPLAEKRVRVAAHRLAHVINARLGD